MRFIYLKNGSKKVSKSSNQNDSAEWGIINSLKMIV